MWQDSKYLKEISRSLANINLLQKQTTQFNSQSKFNWLRIINLVVLATVVLSLPYLVNRTYKPTNKVFTQDYGNTLGIGQLTRQVQNEISKLDKERRENNIAPMFQLQTFELEISFVIKEGSNQSGGAHYEVVTVDNQLQTGSEHVQKLKLTMVVSPSYESAVGPSEPEHLDQVEILGSPPPQKGENK